MKTNHEALGRAADRAVWAVQVAESIQDLVLLVLDNARDRPYADVRRALVGALGELVTRHQRAEREAVDQYVASIRSTLASEVRR